MLRKFLLPLLALVFVGLYNEAPQAAATLDRTVCSTADKAGGDPNKCDGEEQLAAINQEVQRLYGGAVLRATITTPVSVNALVGATTPVATALTDGDMRVIRIGSTNTSTVTYQDNSLAAKQLVSQAGSALGSGDLQANSFYVITYYQTNDEWRVLNNLGTGGTAPATVSYLTLATNALLSAERVLTEGTNGIDFTDGGANGNLTVLFDPTEVGSVTWGSGSSIAWTFDAGATDPVFTMSSAATATMTGGGTSPTFALDDQGILSFFEEDAGGSNKLSFKAPAAITSDATCTFENDTNFIPDSCVGNGTDDGLLSTDIDTSAEIAAIVTNETGTGSIVFSNSPTLVTPALGTPSAVVLTNGTGLPISTGVSGLGTGVATALATPSSANLAAALTDETGSGAAVFATSPTLVTPALGTPSAVVLTNGTGLPVSTGIAGLGAGVATALATPSSANLATALTDETGTGAAVFANSPTLVTPALGTPSAVVLTNGTGLPISTGVSGLAAGVATALATPSSANLRSMLTDEIGTGAAMFGLISTMADDLGCTASQYVARNSGDTAFECVTLAGGGDALTSNPLSQFAATTSLQLKNTISDETGSGALVFATSPTLVTPALGTPSSGTLTNATGLPISTGVSGLGTGVATALAVNVGTAGAPVVNGGALGTPSSGTLTNATGLPISTGVSGLGTGVATALATPSSANFRSALTDEVGTGAMMFGMVSTMADDLGCTGSQIVRRNSGDTAFECATVAGAGDMVAANNLSDVANAATAFSNIKQNATTSATGVVELATTAEAEGGTDSTRAVTADGLLAAFSGKKTIWVPAGAMIAETTTGCAAGTYETSTNQVMYKSLDCDASTKEGAQFLVAMPKSWNESTITFRADWTAASGSGDVVWAFSCMAASNDDVLDTAFGTEVTVTDTLTATGDVDQSPESSAVTASGSPAENDNLWCRVQRDAASGSDTLAVDARLLGVRVLYTTNAMTDD